MSRRLRSAIVIFCTLLVIILVCLDRTRSTQTLAPIPPKQNTIQTDFERYNSRSFPVTKVVDGDTIDIGIPDGNSANTRIRLWGVDTPETKKPNTPVMYFGPEAYKFTTDTVLNKNVRIFLEKKQTRDRYGRLLAFVQLPDGKYLNEELLSEGYAYNDSRFKHSYSNNYKHLESAARRDRKGLWKNVTVDQMPEWRQKLERSLHTQNSSSRFHPVFFCCLSACNVYIRIALFEYCKPEKLRRKIAYWTFDVNNDDSIIAGSPTSVL
jgi:micrococcal nuclease